jgi:hypothetical protein
MFIKIIKISNDELYIYLFLVLLSNLKAFYFILNYS